MRDWLRPLADRDIRRDYKKYAGDTKQAGRELLAATDSLESFTHPVLVVWANEDRVMPPEHGRRLAEIFPNSRLVEVADSYTLIPEDQPEVLAQHLRAFAATDNSAPRSTLAI
jgi:pimeloyl-ACP methyl ester carboxylesterase